jgi:hypothetical protein
MKNALPVLPCGVQMESKNGRQFKVSFPCLVNLQFSLELSPPCVAAVRSFSGLHEAASSSASLDAETNLGRHIPQPRKHILGGGRSVVRKAI